MNPFFNIYIGPMFGSKTTRLLGDIDRLKHKSMKVLALKPNIDSRYDNNCIASHNGGKVKAINIDSGHEIYKILSEEDYNVIAVDEAFMISNIDEVLIDLYKSGKSIIISSIQLDSNEKPFENIRNMLPFGTKVEICPAVCTKCNEDAYFTMALFDIDNASQEEKLGGKEKYEPRCHKHYFI